jgi:large subunit ribosomal protein L17
MRHQVRGRKLGRTSSHRKATLEALSNALIKNERITTTLPKAKELRKFVEPLITRSKVDNLLNRRIVFSALRDKEIVKKIFEEVGPLVADRPGGYTRIIKVGNRSGDGAPVAIIELVDYNDSKPETAGKKKKRTRRGSGKARDETVTKAKAPEKEKAESKKPVKETGAAPAVKDEETAPVAEQTDAVDEVKAEAAEKAAAKEEKAEAKAEAEAAEKAAAKEEKAEAKAEAAEEKAAAKEEKAEAKAEAAEKAAAKEEKAEAKAEAAEKAAAKEEKAEAKAEAAEKAAAKEEKAEAKAEAAEEKAAAKEAKASSDDKKEDDDKKKSDK